MTTKAKLKKGLYTGAIAIGLALGTMGVASAASSQTAPAPAETEVDLQEPSYTGSIEAPADDETLSDTEEDVLLESLATITVEEATAAAQAAVAGDIVEVELDDENGSVVYSVEIVDASGTEVDVKVDAGNGTILDQQTDDDADEDADDDTDDVQHENEHEGENDLDEDHED